MAERVSSQQNKEKLQTWVTEFLRHYREPGANQSDEPYYVTKAKELEAEGLTTMFVALSHLAEFRPEEASEQLSFVSGRDLAGYIRAKYFVLRPFLSAAVAQFISHIESEGMIAYARQKRFTMAFYDLEGIWGMQTIRSLTCESVGVLSTIMGTVTRMTEKKPELHIATFECALCQTEITNVIQQFKLTLPSHCPSNGCNNCKAFILKPESSTTQWSDWQRLRLQELESQVPIGCMPRSMDIILRDEITDTAKPGDKVKLTGCLVCVPDVPTLMRPSEIKEVVRGELNKKFKTSYVEGVRGIGGLGNKELCYKAVFFACHVRQSSDNKDAKDHKTEFTGKDRYKIHEMAKNPDVLSRLASHIAPNIYGCLDVKKGILLQQLGGVEKSTAGDKNKLRGAINICLVGDPSTGKSQFLKYICNLIPRSVFTSGKCSTAAGLTASITRDPEMNDTVIEPGALMLADGGVCCIDDFDKMDLTDQVAIHEAMEQQTITLSKQGIQATLNARCSILAATLPRGHVYDNAKTLSGNLTLSPAMMSRFDLFFILKDEQNDELDLAKVEHLSRLYSADSQKTMPADELTQNEFLAYIKYAKGIDPQISEEARRLIVKAYTLLRAKTQGEVRTMHVTVRQLESLVRLSEAVARAHLSTVVTGKMVDTALQLMQSALLKVEGQEIEIDDITAGDAMGEPEEDEFDARPQPEQRRQVRLTFAQYEKITKMLTHRLDLQTKAGVETSEAHLIDWYLDEVEKELSSEEMLTAEQRKIKNVLDRLITKDRIIVVTSKSDDPRRRFLEKHPNYIVK